MTCAQVADVLDATGLVDVERGLIEAAHAHARRCDVCARVLAASERLDRDLGEIARPEPTFDVSTVVMARIAALEAGGEEPHAADVRHGEAQTPVSRAWGGWRVIAGLAAGLAGLAWGSGGSVLSGQLGFNGLAATVGSLEHLDTGAIALAVGLGLYLIGLFGPDPAPWTTAREHSRRSRPTSD